MNENEYKEILKLCRKAIKIDNLQTQVAGAMQLDIKDGKIRIAWEKALPAGTVFQFPDHFQIELQQQVDGCRNEFTGTVYLLPFR